MNVSDIRTKNSYRNLNNAKVVTVTGLGMATVEFEFNGVKQVPMLKTLFAANFTMFF